ncbi:MAG: alpha-1,2-fucosyltransferase [Thermoanaerobaculales bacterium]|nr:alpha-1,2-fucosyltransferase [Thermoanaerobaculales bacterium]
MIVAGLTGGLGNQLFEYALARRISHDRGLPLKLDITGFDIYRLHAYSLQNFSIRQEFADPAEVSRLKSIGRRHFLTRRIQKLLPINRRTWIVERQFKFDPLILRTTRRQLYLQGYWQSEEYFKDIRPILLRELMVTTEPDAVNREFAARISELQAVSLHIRRGDYVTNSTTAKVHGVMPLNYYHHAVREISDLVPNPHFFIFSDDPPWARDHLALELPFTIMGHNAADRNYEDLRLMALCRHHIIANSSFSWWGAWLCQNPDPIVFAPEKWFSDSSLDTSDLIPSRWRRI